MRTLLILPLLMAAYAVTHAPYAAASSDPAPSAHSPITAEMIEEAQRDWIAALVSIGAAHAEGASADRAAYVLDRYYDFGGAGVVFKPTLTHGEQTFRTNREGALAYFVGGNDAFPNDGGFALTGYTDGKAHLEGFVAHGDVAVAVSRVTLTAPDGGTVAVDKTFGYRLAEDGRLRIISHHSSLPFSPYTP